MKERKSFFCGLDNHKLFAIHFPGEPEKPVAVLCQPYGYEAVKTRRVYFNIAKEWAAKGIDVLLFDYYGTGNSWGEFYELRWSGMLEDIQIIIDEACNITKKNKIILAGLRLGASTAAIVAENDKRVESVILWQPIIYGSNYLLKVLRSNIATQMAINHKVSHNQKQLISKIQKGEFVYVNGFELTKEFFNEVTKLNLFQMIGKYKKQCTIIDISPRPNVKISSEYKELNKFYIENGASCDLRLAIEKNFWTELKYYYQNAFNMLHESERALLI